MSNQDLVSKTAKHIENKFITDSTGHDWWHMYRVWQLAKKISEHEEPVDLLIVELGALLHDIADFKFHDGDLEAGPNAARLWLESIHADEKIITGVEDIVRNVSFKGAGVKNNLKSKEGQIVHDADKLDAIGAIGIARVFAYGGAHGRMIYDPSIKPVLHKSFDEYYAGKPSAIGHFHEKLLLLKDRMYTKTGRDMAEKRHVFMKQFLNEFHEEWDGAR